MDEIWASAPFHIFLGLAATLPIVVWDWRFALPGLLVAQLGTGTIFGSLYTLSAPWPAVHLGVLVFACLILLLSILQTRTVQVDQTGEFSSILFRTLVLGIAALLVWRASGGIPLPLLDDSTKHLMIWFAVLALVTLGLAETALFGGIALLLWLIPVQSFFAALFPSPAVIVPLGIMEILVALSCSYLLLVDDNVMWTDEIAATDPGQPFGVQRRLSIAAGARVLWHGLTYWVYSRVNRRQHHAARKGQVAPYHD